MSKKNFYSGRDRELHELSEKFDAVMQKGESFYADADDFADLADWYAMRRRYAKAQDVVEYGLRLHPGNTALLVEQAYLCFDTKDDKKGRAIAESITEDTEEVIVLRAYLLMCDGREKEAEQLLETLDDPQDLPNIIDVTYMYIDAGCPQKAWDWLQKGKEKYGERESYLAVTADCHYALGELEEAAECFNKIIDMNPYSASYWAGLARCHYDMGDLERVIEDCDYAIVADEEFGEAYALRGHAFFELGNDEEALKCYEKAEEYYSLPASFTHVFVGLTHIAHQEWREGLIALEQALDGIDADEFVEYMPISTVYSNAALCAYNLGNPTVAHAYCDDALRLDPDDVSVLLFKGKVYAAEGKDEECFDCWKQAVDIDPSADTWNDIASFSMELGNTEFAMYAFQKVKEIDPDFELIDERIATLCLVARDMDNFWKYNAFCKKPYSNEEVEKVLHALDSCQNEEELLTAMKGIFNSRKQSDE